MLNWLNNLSWLFYLVVVHQKKIDFTFRKSFNCCLDQASCIDSDLFIEHDSELGQMKNSLRLNSGLQKQKQLILEDPGGIDKTQLALSFTNQHKDDYTFIFWLNASSETTLKESYLSIAKLIFDIRDLEILEEEQNMTYVHRWLSDQNNEKWLLLFDNYDESKSYEIKQYYSSISHETIIVTTRLPDRVTEKDVRIQIQSLSKIEEGLEILRIRSKREDAKKDAFSSEYMYAFLVSSANNSHRLLCKTSDRATRQLFIDSDFCWIISSTKFLHI